MQRNGMASASFVLGIISIVSAFFGFFIIGPLGITFALLSRDEKMNSTALTGFILSLIGSVLSIIVLVFTYAFLFNMSNMLKDPALREQIEDIFEEFNMDEYYENPEEYYEDFFDEFEDAPDSFEDYFNFDFDNDFYGNDNWNDYGYNGGGNTI